LWAYDYDYNLILPWWKQRQTFIEQMYMPLPLHSYSIVYLIILQLTSC